MIETNEYRAAKAVEKIAQKLLEERENIPFDLYPIDEYYFRMPTEQQAKSRPFQLILVEGSKKTGIIFCDSKYAKQYDSLFRNGEYEVDSLKIVLLAEPSGVAYETMITLENERSKRLELSVEYVTVKQFWEKYFGAEEYSTLVMYINEFNERAKGLIGFNTVITPTEVAIKQFKERTGKMLQEHPYSNNIPDEVYRNQVEILYQNYINRGLWRAMISNKNFAVSFISSEWYLQMYQLTENLDLTGIVAGYLKSVEQLLFSVVELSKDKGITIKSKYHRDFIEYSTENEVSVDTTLGSLQRVMAYNDLFWPEVNKYARHHIDQMLNDWREKQRNGYFHKDNLQSIERIEEIRNKALQLYFFILGASKISENQFEKLGISC